MITVLRAGPLTTVQDLGRPGWAHLGVPRSGAADAPALRLANRLVGNPPTAAGLETTLLGCALRFGSGRWVAVTGAPAPVTVTGPPADPTGGGMTRAPAGGPGAAGGAPGGGDRVAGVGGPGGGSRVAGAGGPVWVPAGGTLEVGAATAGLRSYVAVGGGLAVPETLGSRSTDRLSGLGPAPLADGDVLPLGRPGAPGAVDLAPLPPIAAEPVLRLAFGPRADWLADPGLLAAAAFTVSSDSDRIGVRLQEPALPRARTDELPSEPIVLGALQLPADGRPVLFLADHPTTGGYPVVGVVHPDDVPLAAQARPGTRLRFRPVRPT